MNDTENRTPLKELNFQDSDIYRYSALKAPLSSMKDKLNSSYHNTNSTNSNTNNSVTTNYDTTESLLQSKIDYLEQDRIKLTMQLHKRDEKDREKKIKYDTIETNMKSIQKHNSQLLSKIKELETRNNNLLNEKSIVDNELTKLKKDHNNTTKFEAQEIWTKITASSRELKKCEEEIKLLTTNNNDLINENDQLITTNNDLIHKNNELMNTNNLLLQKLSVLEEENMELITSEDTNKNLINELTKKSNYLIEQLELITIEKDNLCIDKDNLLNNCKKYEHELNLFKENGIVANHNSNSSNNNESSLMNNENNMKLLSIIDELNHKLLDCELKRRQLHNKLQDLRGNIRVFIRCRPFLSCDSTDHHSCNDNKETLVQCLKDGVGIMIQAPPANGIAGSTKVSHSTQQFLFDKVFSQSSSQEEIYTEVSDLIQSALDGYRVCLFSYGQTGSGKTHTMTGDVNGDGRGIIPRAFHDIMTQSQAMQGSGWTISLGVSIVELYNEDLRDLLADGKYSTDHLDHNTKNKYKITKVNNKVVVQGLTSIPIDVTDYATGMLQFEKVITDAATVRSTASTSMNSTSSRSHLVVMIDIAGRHEDGITFMQGGLRLCDLAGSERLDRTGTASDANRLKETVNINKSLSCLADVFCALSNKASHIPYRNSKLTMLLQDCLSGDGKALMLVNVSPTIASTQETICSLRFANQVSQVELGKANKQIFTAANMIAHQIADSMGVPAESSTGSVTTASANSIAPAKSGSRRMSVMGGKTSLIVSKSVDSALENTSVTMTSGAVRSLIPQPMSSNKKSQSVTSFIRSPLSEIPTNERTVRFDVSSISTISGETHANTWTAPKVTKVGGLGASMRSIKTSSSQGSATGSLGPARVKVLSSSDDCGNLKREKPYDDNTSNKRQRVATAAAAVNSSTIVDNCSGKGGKYSWRR